MDSLEQFLEAAVGKGVRLNGIRPKRIPDGGIGMVAERDLQPAELLLRVPRKLFLSLDVVSNAVKSRLPGGATTHCALATALCVNVDDSSFLRRWKAVLPSRADVEACMPVAWPKRLQALLPTAARRLLAEQATKLDRDWALARKGLGASADDDNNKNSDRDRVGPVVSREEFVAAWLLVNTRCFHHPTAATRFRPHRDRIVLQPVADLFNHAADPCCDVGFDSDGFSVRADRAYAAGEEVRFCYGRHSGDALLVEYGFAMKNKDDEAAVDEAVLARVPLPERQVLEAHNFLGRYFIDADGACYRTHVAVRLLCVERQQWDSFLLNGSDAHDANELDDDTQTVQRRVDILLADMLQDYLCTIDTTVADIQGMRDDEEGAGTAYQRRLLHSRWEQVRTLVALTVRRPS